MAHSELDRIGEIDRSEEIPQDYVQRDGVLQLKEVEWSVPRWASQGDNSHSVSGKIAAWQPWLEQGGTMLGAFDGEALRAFAIYRPGLSEGTAQFAVIHVDRRYRRRGIGASLAAKVIELARTDDARSLYVSSAPTRGTVEFYQSLGFQPTACVNQELFELEPEDIHMTMAL